MKITKQMPQRPESLPVPESHSRSGRRAAKLTACAAALLMTAALAGCQRGSGSSDQAESAIADGVLTVGIVNGGDGFADSESSGYTGMEPDILNTFGEAQGVQVEYKQAGDEKSLITMLDSGEVDLAAGCLTLAETFTNGHLASRNYAKRGLCLITEQNRYVDTLAGCDEGTVGLSWLIPAYQLPEIQNIAALQQTTYSSIVSIPDDIADSVIDAALVTEREAAAILSSGAKVHAAELRNGPRLEYVFYLAPGQEELQAQLNAAINSWLDIQADPEKETTGSALQTAPAETAPSESAAAAQTAPAETTKGE